jgi:hypothetical protein
MLVVLKSLSHLFWEYFQLVLAFRWLLARTSKGSFEDVSSTQSLSHLFWKCFQLVLAVQWLLTQTSQGII